MGEYDKQYNIEEIHPDLKKKITLSLYHGTKKNLLYL